MFKRSKIQSVGTISEFMNREKETLHESEIIAYEKTKPSIIAALSMLPLAVSTNVNIASASTHTNTLAVTANAQMYDKMVQAFDPLIVLVQALAYPIATVVVLAGGLMVMIGMKEKGYSLMMGAGLGYVLVNMTPMVLNILVEAMKAV